MLRLTLLLLFLLSTTLVANDKQPIGGFIFIYKASEVKPYYKPDNLIIACGIADNKIIFIDSSSPRNFEELPKENATPEQKQGYKTIFIDLMTQMLESDSAALANDDKPIYCVKIQHRNSQNRLDYYIYTKTEPEDIINRIESLK